MTLEEKIGQMTQVDYRYLADKSDIKKYFLGTQVDHLWDAAVVPAILKLHNKKINGLEVKIYRVCSGVKGMSVKNQKKYRNELKSKGKINLIDEFKNIKRQNIILNLWAMD